MKSKLVALLTSSVILFSGVALADVAPDDPCDGASEGDSCTTTAGTDGSCTSDGNGGLVCTVDEGGCTMSARPASGDLAGLALAALGLAAWTRRRR
ncbi:MAG: hypothetical protein KC731_19245 [Myxococcales bacterium]|nr:hypothetical protein [Myxococcales bacterium]